MYLKDSLKADSLFRNRRTINTDISFIGTDLQNLFLIILQRKCIRHSYLCYIFHPKAGQKGSFLLRHNFTVQSIQILQKINFFFLPELIIHLKGHINCNFPALSIGVIFRLHLSCGKNRFYPVHIRIIRSHSLDFFRKGKHRIHPLQLILFALI